MATWTDVRRITGGLPETTEQSSYNDWASWKVRGKSYAWERPLSDKDGGDLRALGREVPDGPILAIRVAGTGAKEELLGSAPDVYFSIPHFDSYASTGYAALLIRLDTISADELGEVLQDAWLLRAPKRLAKAYLDQHPPAQ